MPTRGEIGSKKIPIKDVFKKWFCIPEYQRPYVWGYEQIHDLLDDLTYAMKEKPNSEYFLGSFVFQIKPANPNSGQEFLENDLLDGQQRLVTLLLMMAVIRDLVDDPVVEEKCQAYIYQRADPIENIPERNRLTFTVREGAQEFIDQHIKPDASTNDRATFDRIIKRTDDISIKNMAKALLELHSFFTKNGNINLKDFLSFVVTKVLMIYVASEDLEDAFRLFTILNDRGIPLRNSDILKAKNLGALESEADKKRYAKMWEDAEGELGDEFDRFLNHVRTILVKERARLSLLREFEDKIYDPKEIDKKTHQRKPPLLKRGKDTFALIEKYLGHYKNLLGGQNYDDTGGSFEFDNLVKVMLAGLPATDWIPPLLRYFDKFEYERILEFLKKLDNKFSVDLIGQRTPTDRIEAMNNIIKLIDEANSVDEVLNSHRFDFDDKSLKNVLESSVYGKRFVKYLLLKLDYLYANHDQRMHFETLSVEHILPQTPDQNSQWSQDFSPEEREELTHKLGNLVLITRRKNSSLGRLDYIEKEERYFAKSIDTRPYTLRVLHRYSQWTPEELRENQNEVLNKLWQHYGIYKHGAGN
ncbi:hypothetical protein ES703_15681 [subsurface metagenome]|nr:DUF262 domain-containing protein [bacterium]